jgi:crotonobetainyl-CoA:carnitine CoA-transferase CaiB-like acyl-CoA transferase
MTGDQPLSGVRVLDLSTLLPGPLATLLLAEAGADVVKIERPGTGDEMRGYTPKLGAASANYAVLNRGKRAYAADLKDPASRDRVLVLASQADVVVEQFRPGVAHRLGLGYEQVRAVNPEVIYCSITGYGQDGPNSQRAGHDLNYVAETGLLSTVVDSHGKPPLPPTVIADIASGTYPAVMNILFALRRRDRTGAGCHLDISMTHNLQLLSYGFFATHQAGGGWPTAGKELLTGGSPRYQIYATSDGRHIAVAALEQKFWERLAELIDLPTEYLDDQGQEEAVIEVLSHIIGAKPATFWRQIFDGEDVCSVVVATFAEAAASGFVHTDSPVRLVSDGFDIGTLPSSVDPSVRSDPESIGYPETLLPLAHEHVWPARPN